jgi:hypothetical protein
MDPDTLKNTEFRTGNGVWQENILSIEHIQHTYNIYDLQQKSLKILSRYFFLQKCLPVLGIGLPVPVTLNRIHRFYKVGFDKTWPGLPIPYRSKQFSGFLRVSLDPNTTNARFCKVPVAPKILIRSNNTGI